MLAPEKLQPHATNPYAAHPCAFTLVTPDMAASIAFYRDVMGNEVVGEGPLEGPLPAVDGIGAPGRCYTLMKHREENILDRGVIRLLEAPAGASAMRPRPDTAFHAPGLGVIECHSDDFDEAHRFMADHRVKTVSKPQYYFWGDPDAPYHSTTAFSAFGPAGEQFLISTQNVPDVFKQMREVAFPGHFGPITSHSLMCYSRWPLLAFYETVFGLTKIRDRAIPSEPIARLCGLPPKTYFLHTMPGEGTRMEFWEFLQFGPPPSPPPHPCSLDKTGVVMTTMLVDDVDAVRHRAIAADIPILADGMLPLPTPYAPGFYLRGPVGELLEVVGRL